MTNPLPYTLNAISEFYWEICRGGFVEQFIAKTADDDNREAAVRRVRYLNGKLAKNSSPTLRDEGGRVKAGADTKGAR